MATVSSLQPKMSACSATAQHAVPETASSTDQVRYFHPDEPDMMPGDWGEAGNPTPYELRVTLHTCRRLLQLNRDALHCQDCDPQSTWDNIKILEKLHIHLMDYLVE